MIAFMKNAISRKLIFVFAAAASIQIVICFIWIFHNITVVPQYGDTTEYLKLSKTFALDKFRTILYPLILRGTIFSGAHLGLPYQAVTYVFQMALSFASILYLINILFKNFSGFAKNNKYLVFFTSLFIFSDPLITHFNLSVLSDSIALSFTIFFLGSILEVCAADKISPAKIIAVFSFYILMSLSRPERVMLGLAFLIFTAVFELFKNRKIKSKEIVKKSVCLLITAAAAFAIISSVNGATQKATVNRNQPAIYKSAFELIVFPRLTKVYPYLPSSIKSVITYKDAVTNDASANNTNYTISKILDHDNGNPSKINEITKITLSRLYPEIIGTFVSNVCKNMLSPVCYVFNFKLNDGIINWTQTRMSLKHPRLTSFYVFYSNVLFILLLITAIFGIIRKKILRFLRKPVFEISVFFALLFSLFFSAVSDMGFHIRYAMPVYAVFVIFTCFFAALTLLPFKTGQSHIRSGGL